MAGLFERLVAAGEGKFVEEARGRDALTTALLCEARRRLSSAEPIVYDLTEVAALWWSSGEYGSYDVATVPQLALPGGCFFAEYKLPARVRYHLRTTGESLEAGASLVGEPVGRDGEPGFLGRIATAEVGRVGALLVAPEPGGGVLVGARAVDEHTAVHPGSVRVLHVLIFLSEPSATGDAAGPYLRYAVPLREDASPLAAADLLYPPAGEGTAGALVHGYVEMIAASLLGPIVFGLGLLACGNVRTAWCDGPFLSYRKPVVGHGSPEEERGAAESAPSPPANEEAGRGPVARFRGGHFVSERGRLLWMWGPDARGSGR